MHVVFKSHSTTGFTMKNSSPVFPPQIPVSQKPFFFAITAILLTQKHANSTILDHPIENGLVDFFLRKTRMRLFHSFVLGPPPPLPSYTVNSFSVPTLSFAIMLTRVCSISFLMCLPSGPAILIFAYPMCKSVSVPSWELEFDELNSK